MINKEENIHKISNHITKYSINILARSIIDSTFSEHCNEFSHSMSMVWVIQMFELFMKSKLFKLSPELIFKWNNKVDFFNSKTISIYETIKLFNRKFNINIDKRKIQEFIDKRNQLVHFWFSNHEYDISKLVLEFIFELIIPILEKYYITDLDYLFDSLWNRDDCIFEDYVIDLLDEYWIIYSNSIKNKFTYCNLTKKYV